MGALLREIIFSGFQTHPSQKIIIGGQRCRDHQTPADLNGYVPTPIP